MGDRGAGLIKHEDDLSGALAGAFREGSGTSDANYPLERGGPDPSAEREREKYGADLLIHVKLETSEQSYTKGVLVQAKHIGPGENMSGKHHQDLKDQCNTIMGTPE